MIKPFAERTTSLIGGFSTGFTTKLGQLKNSESFRSLEERVGSAYENVKVSERFEENIETEFVREFWHFFQTRVTPSRSNSIQSFDEAIREAEQSRSKSASHTPATTPTIPE